MTAGSRVLVSSARVGGPIQPHSRMVSCCRPSIQERVEGLGHETNSQTESSCQIASVVVVDLQS